MARVIAADVIDSRKDDWTISDDSTSLGPIRSWPAPRLPIGNNNPAFGPKARLTRSGLDDAYAFLRPLGDRPVRPLLGFDDEDAPDVPTADVSGIPSYRYVEKPAPSFASEDLGFDRYEAGMLLSTAEAKSIVDFMRRTDAGALDACGAFYWSMNDARGFGDEAGFFGAIFKAVGGAFSGVAKGVASVAKGIAKPVASLVASPFKLTSDIVSGKNVFQSFKDTVKRDITSVKEVAPYVQAVISVIPGVGQGVNAAIAAGSALAQGQPITSAIVAGLKGALPGGPLAAQAFDTAYNVARGQNVGEAALQALVNNAPGGAIGKQAAQAAVAIAKGQNIQQAALTAVKSVAAERLGSFLPANSPDVLRVAVSDLAKGKSVIDTAKSAVGTVAMDKLSPFALGVMNNAGPRIASTVAAVIPSILPTDVKMVASSLLATPALRNLPVEELSRRLGVSTHAVRDGMGAVLQAVQKSGGPRVPSLSYARTLASRIPMGMSFDRAMPAFASKVAPKVYSHNVASPAVAAARLRRAGSIFQALSARGLDCGALDPSAMPTIRQGSTGDAVIQWQKILKVTADGKFGPQTTLATKAFQSRSGLTPDGIVGPKSWTAGLVNVISTAPPATVPGTSIPMSVPPPATVAPIIAGAMPTIRRGSTGAPVTTWQTFLGIAADGKFGPQTEDATKSFQTRNGLTADGIVGPKSWEKAMSGTSTPPTPIRNTPPPLPPTVITMPPVVISTPGGDVTLPPFIPPFTVPGGIPGQGLPGVPPLPPLPPGPPSLPPVVTTPPKPPNDPGQPPAPPRIKVTRPGLPPVILPPKPPVTKTAGMGLLPVAVGLGLLVFAMSGTRQKLT